MAEIKCVCIAKARKTRTYDVNKCYIDENGFEGDIHYGMKKKAPVSLLPYDRILEYFHERQEPVNMGRFGENLLIEGMNWDSIAVGKRLKCGGVILEVTRIGAGCPAADAFQGEKVCYPMEPFFVFCKVCRGGIISAGMQMEIFD